jgi:hypothetical protein
MEPAPVGHEALDRGDPSVHAWRGSPCASSADAAARTERDDRVHELA